MVGSAAYLRQSCGGILRREKKSCVYLYRMITYLVARWCEHGVGTADGSGDSGKLPASYWCVACHLSIERGWV